MNVEGPSADLPERRNLSPEQERRLRQIVEEFLEQLQAGAAPNRYSIAAGNPDLAAVLESRLELVERVFLAAQRTGVSSPATGPVAGPATPASGTERELASASGAGDRSSGDAATSAYVSASGQASGSVTVGATQVESAAHLRCPHCGNAIQIVAPNPHEFTCHNCGSTFRLNVQSARYRGRIKQPERIGRFAVKAVLGHGGFGVVYKAVDAELDRTVAIKVPRAGYFTSSEEEERFLREARHAARLNHPNIVQVHEIGHESGVPYIVSDYIEGVTLADRMQAGLMSFRESAELIATVCDAIEFAHRHKVVHRDIKPGNILLDLAGRPFLNDFGLARRDEGEITVTIDGQVLGTPAFMSPEQASGDHAKVGPHSDVYSLGVVLYRMISGELPFHGSRRMLLQQVIHDDPKPPSSLNQHIPRDLGTICMKAMAKEPSRRYAAAREMADDIRRWLGGEPILARPVGRTERMMRWCHRNPVTAGLSAAIAGLLVLLTLSALVSACNDRRLRNVAQHAEQAERSERARAEHNADLSRQRLARMHTTNGVQLLSEGDLFGSMPWFAAALELESGNPEREFVQRVRLGATLRAGPKLAQVFVHQGALRHGDLSRDASCAITAGDDAARVWDTTTGAELAVLRHADAVLWASLSPDSRRAVTASRDHTAAVWTLADQRQEPLRLEHKDWVKSAVFSPDGRFVLTASNDNTAAIWNAATGERVHVLEHATNVLLAAFSRDGGLVVTVSNAGFGAPGEARIWSTADGELVAGPFRHADYVFHASFSSDGRRLATASQDATAVVWDIATGEQVAGMRHLAAVRSAFFSEDGLSLTTASADGAARVWKIDDGRSGPALKHRDMLMFATPALDGAVVATAALDGTARAWNARTGELLVPPMRHTDVVVHVAVSPDGRWLLSVGRDQVAKLWDLAGGEPAMPPFQHAAALTAAEFSPDGQRVATASDDKTAAVWNARDATKPLHVLQHGDSVRHVRFSPDGRMLVTCGADGLVQLWDVQSGLSLFPPLRHQAAVWKAVFSSNGEFIATASDDRTARLWSTATGELKATLRHAGPVFATAFSTDGQLVVTASEDRTARVWRVPSGEPVGQPLNHADRVVTTAFSSDGRLVATASSDRTAKVWEVATGRLIATLPHTGSVWSVRFSPDSSRLATANLLGMAGIWDAATGQLAAPILRHDAYQVRHAAYNDDGRLLVTTSNRTTEPRADRLDAGVVRLWDASTGEPVSPPLRHGAPVRSGWFSPDSRWLISASEDHTGQLWDVSADERSQADLIELASLLCGHRAQETGGLVPLAPSELGELWARLRPKHASTFVASEAEVAAWKRRQARLLSDANRDAPR
jgi:WD40 repeat protein